MKLYTKSAAQLAHMVRKKEVCAVEVAQDFLGHIQKTEAAIQAFLHLDEAAILCAARQLDKKLAAGKAGPLAGVPVGLKDNICTKGVPTTCGSRMLKGFLPPYSATVVRRLIRAGALFFGKLNMDEFAMGNTCENSFYQTTHNPWNPRHVPGGSSGGSAAAVAAGQVPLALGSDTGGSVRTPAAHCGVVGLKPTYGAVSRYGLVAFASSLEQIGPLACTVEDAELLFYAVAGRDTHDATCTGLLKGPARKEGLRGLRIGISPEYFADKASVEVQKCVATAVQTLRTLGANTREVTVPFTQQALAAYYVLSSAEASSNLARYDGIRYGGFDSAGNPETVAQTRGQCFGPEVKRRILLGTHVLSAGYGAAYYQRAKRVQHVLRAQFNTLFEKCDVLLTPTVPHTAPKLGAQAQNQAEMYKADLCTVPANLAGLPALSVPCGLGPSGLPVGMQLIGPAYSEALLLDTAKKYERVVGGFRRAEVAR